ncbi:PREDICTED: TNF receptor-associated factor 4-like [Amphimedon queenslandica]|uniref:RING-type E3 ubiquitin transferase n=2 Tax=Amphimedon queenslandica TaxID=400682 RepID=A0AAN0IRW7_AMPQE|nr:PREDICTED: TNF receptor-associated factor 4-like [Amphimedon queenslandica]|eukprot:XP_011407980.2 PREDICTED: TNF receptor-associated factor 4-like [Amphimedon queenslandica]
MNQQQQQHVLQQPMEEVTKNISTSKDYGGYDYSFISSHEELHEFICPICRLVLRSPHLTDCCGACFCSTCIREHISLDNSCPLCKKEHYSVFIHRNIERSINRLQVKCPNNADGCVWVGPLVDVATHVDLNKGDCDFVRCLCPFCEEEFSLNTLYTHKTDECPRRPYSCKFCSFKSAYEDMPSHWPLCDGYPAPCPNDCGSMDMPRRDIPQHLEVCPRKIIECDFKFLGCDSTYPLSDARVHEESSAHFHMSLMGRMVRELMNREATPTGPTHEDLEGRLEEKDRELSLLREQVQVQGKELGELRSLVSTLEESQAKLAKDLQKVRSHVVTPPFHFTVYKFSELRSSGKQWFSSPFYTHPQGYRMCISLDCNGSDEGRGTHVSVYANLMRGEFDDELSWPFCGIVVIQLINQYGGGDKGGHIVHEIPFTPDVPLEISDRILDQELAESGLGVPQFVAHGQLQLDKYTNCGYLRNECLRFCVTSIRRN